MTSIRQRYATTTTTTTASPAGSFTLLLLSLHPAPPLLISNLDEAGFRVLSLEMNAISQKLVHITSACAYQGISANDRHKRVSPVQATSRKESTGETSTSSRYLWDIAALTKINCAKNPNVSRLLRFDCVRESSTNSVFA
eukprot:2005161-Pyramimonas_sp.AAC.2